MTSLLSLQILTPDQERINSQVASLLLPGKMGYLQVFPGHSPMVVLLGAGLLQAYHSDGSHKSWYIDQGLANINSSSCTVLVS